MATRKISGAAVEHVVSGSYQRDIVSEAGLNATVGTEFEIGDLATAVIAQDGKDELYSWIRCNLLSYRTGTTGGFPFEWAVIRCKSTDSNQDLNSSSAMEYLQTAGRILARGLEIAGNPIYRGNPRIKFELFNVKIPDTEELRLLVRPLMSVSDNTVCFEGILEWRQIGV